MNIDPRRRRNISEYIRVEVSDAVEAKSLSPKISPKGFKAVINPIPTASFTDNVIFPSASYEGLQQIGGNYSSRAYLGWKFTTLLNESVPWLSGQSIF